MSTKDLTPMPEQAPLKFDEEAALRTVLEGTAIATGERFFDALVENLARALHTYGAWVTEYLKERRQLRPLAFWLDGRLITKYQYDITGTPCESLLENRRLIHIPDRLLEQFPGDPEMRGLGIVSYLGVPLLDLDGNILGHLAVVDTRPMPEEPRSLALFQIFAARAAAELQRLRAEAEVREREAQLGRLIDSAMDAILQLDRSLNVVLVNAAAEKAFGRRADALRGRSIAGLLAEHDRARFAELTRGLDGRPEGARSLWIPGGLTALAADGRSFPAEATLSRFELRREPFYTVILRNVNERLEAERTIRSLTGEAEYLREELRALRHFDEIIGRSLPMLRVLQDVKQVAETDSTVLLLGESGTGKELIARAIHAAGRRRERPMITVNCAAIPAHLIESELFGHEKGAFTGAIKKRDGRFALADGGTLFLDEIGELPVELQPKLLRVLQEGQFEPVGSSQTRTVDIRVVAATNRDLSKMMKEGAFREDLYYRLSVFPIRLPPLRERPEDVPLLAAAFAERIARGMGRRLAPLSRAAVERLTRYTWPGNVRELQNVIERAVITARDGDLNLDRALPEAAPSAPAREPEAPVPPGDIRTAKEMEALERQNILSALEASGWKVAGKTGAAHRLGMKPSTLTSRIKALRIKRPG